MLSTPATPPATRISDRPMPAPARVAFPPVKWAARRAALDALSATAFDDVLRAQNRLVARALGVSR